MSSFIVQPETISRIVSFIDDATSNGSIWSNSFKSLLQKYDIKADTAEDLDRLANALLLLNKFATDKRYNEKNLVKAIRFGYVHSSDVQVYKSIRCLLYQCSEEDVPTYKLYKFLEELADKLAYKIIADMQEYDKAEWG